MLEPSIYKFTKVIMGNIPKFDKPVLTLGDVLNVVSTTTTIPIDLITQKTRKREIADARHIFCYIAWNYTSYTLHSIGTKLNGKHYSTIINARDKIADCIEFDPILRNMVEIIVNKVTTSYKTKNRFKDEIQRW